MGRALYFARIILVSAAGASTLTYFSMNFCESTIFLCHTRSAKEQVSDVGAVRADVGSLIGSGNHS